MTLRQRLPRERDEKHLDFIRSLPCCVCGDDVSTEAAHLRAGNLDYGKRHTGMSEKPSDKFCLPLCNRHHREQHGASEVDFWANHGIDPWRLSLSLFGATGDSEMAYTILERQGRYGRAA